MLKNLYIENIAVIEKTTIDFSNGLNVLTGETGAGKSIVIDSINAVLGNRTSRDLIRNGSESAFVSAEFEDISQKALETLHEYGFDTDDGTLIIQREISLNSKGKCRINGRPATVSILKAVGTYLINIHGQHESYELMSPELHINYIDKLGNLKNDIDEYAKAYQEYRALKSELDKAQFDEAERNRKIDLLQYQVSELEQADMYAGEFEELKEQRTLIENKEKIANTLNETHSLLNGSEDTGGILEQLENACSCLENIIEYMPDTQDVLKRMQSTLYELEDCTSEISGLADSTDSDVGNLEEIEDRIDLIQRLSRKYGSTIEEMLDFLNKAKRELEYLERYEENREQLKENCQKAFEKAEKLAENLSQMRKKISVQFSARVKEEMTFLDMPNVELVVSQKKCPLNHLGCDDIEILISTNVGEEPKPVAKIASGGELSRMMLAIKNVIADKDEIDTLIFDEVDTGISGSAAQKVGFKNRQVVCVTHLAQIAALADTHFKIQKNVINGKTYTNVNALDHDGRRDELARIIGGVEITQATLDYAEEMLKPMCN